MCKISIYDSRLDTFGSIQRGCDSRYGLAYGAYALVNCYSKEMIFERLGIPVMTWR